MADDGFFSEEELKNRATIRNMRMGIIEEAVKDGTIPSDPREIRLLNEVATSVDNEMVETAKIRARADESSKNRDTLSVVAALLMRDPNEVIVPTTSTPKTLPEHLNKEFDADLLSIGTRDLELADYLPKEEN